MINRVKIIFNEEHETLGYLIQNDKFEWVRVPETSKLSRQEYTHISLEDNSKKIIDYISDIYAPGSDDTVEIVLEAFPHECHKFISEVGNYDNVKVITGDINILVCGKIKSGKSTLIQALTKSDECITYEQWDIYKMNNISWYEVPGLDIEEGSYEKVTRCIFQLLEEVKITTIIYCTTADGNRLENAESELIDDIKKKSPETQVIIAITKAIDEVGTKKWAKTITESHQGVTVVPVLAKDIATKLGVVEAYGLYTINNCIFEGI